MADVFDTGSAPGGQFKILAFPNPKPRPDPAPSPPDEGVDPFGIPRNIPSGPERPAPVLLVPSPKPQPSVADSDTTPDQGETTVGPGDSPHKAVAPTGPDGRDLNDEAAHLGLPTSAPRPPKTPTHGRSGLRRSTRNIERSTIWTRRSTTKPGRGTISTCGIRWPTTSICLTGRNTTGPRRKLPPTMGLTCSIRGSSRRRRNQKSSAPLSLRRRGRPVRDEGVRGEDGAGDLQHHRLRHEPYGS